MQTSVLFSKRRISENLVDLERHCKMNIRLQKSAWKQPRTSRLNLWKKGQTSLFSFSPRDFLSARSTILRKIAQKDSSPRRVGTSAMKKRPGGERTHGRPDRCAARGDADVVVYMTQGDVWGWVGSSNSGRSVFGFIDAEFHNSTIFLQRFSKIA